MWLVLPPVGPHAIRGGGVCRAAFVSVSARLRRGASEKWSRPILFIRSSPTWTKSSTTRTKPTLPERALVSR
jgi:hypothetical protein